MSSMSQAELDQRNAEFWDEVCGTNLARRTKTLDNLEAFDAEYFKLYPFLPEYLDKIRGHVLEIGIGYGTVAHYLSVRCCSYLGLDIAERPLQVLAARGLDGRQGNALDLPFPDGSFDSVVSIGCIHHTGNMPRAVGEIRRVLRSGGCALVMVYNAEAARRSIDRNTKHQQAPCTEYCTTMDVLALFALWERCTISRQNGEHQDFYIEAVK